MTISASLDGAFSAPTRMWASYGGEWVEVSCTPPVTGPRELTITLKGTPGNGTIEVGNVEVGGFYSLYSRYGAGWMDFMPKVLATKTATADPLVFSASDLDTVDRAMAANGWRSGIYIARGTQERLGDESPDLMIAGEARLAPQQVMSSVTFTSGRTLSTAEILSVGTSTGWSSYLHWLYLDLLDLRSKRTIYSMDLHAQTPDNPPGWTIGPATHMRATSYADPTASKFNVFRTGGRTVGGTQKGEVLLTGGLNYNAWVPVSAAWDTPPWITLHNYPADGWVPHPKWQDMPFLALIGVADGPRQLEFAATSTSFSGTPTHQVTMVQTDPKTIRVSGPANVTVWVVYMNPLYAKAPRTASMPAWHNAVIEVVLDGSGSGTITAADFDPAVYEWMPGEDRVLGGRYVAVNAVRAAQVLVYGPAMFQPSEDISPPGAGGSTTDWWANVSHTLSPGTPSIYGSLSGGTTALEGVGLDDPTPGDDSLIFAFGSAVKLEDAHIDPAFEITDRNWAIGRDDTDGSLPAKYLVRFDSHSASYIPPPVPYLDLTAILDPDDGWWAPSDPDPPPGAIILSMMPEPADWGQGEFWIMGSQRDGGFYPIDPTEGTIFAVLYVYEVGAKDGWSGHVYP